MDGAATFTKGPSTKLRESTSSGLDTKLQGAIPAARLTGSVARMQRKCSWDSFVLYSPTLMWDASSRS